MPSNGHRHVGTGLCVHSGCRSREFYRRSRADGRRSGRTSGSLAIQMRHVLARTGIYSLHSTIVRAGERGGTESCLIALVHDDGAGRLTGKSRHVMEQCGAACHGKPLDAAPHATAVRGFTAAARSPSRTAQCRSQDRASCCSASPPTRSAAPTAASTLMARL